MKPGKKNTEMTILAPFDFTLLSVNSLKIAIAMCIRHNAALHIVHAIENEYIAFPHPASSFAGGDFSYFDSLKAIKNYLVKVKIYCEKQTGKKVSTHIKKGSPAEVICSVASKVNANLIVMGAHGASGFREFFIGSNAYRVVKNAPAPVLTIPGTFQKNCFDNILFPVRNVEGVVEKYEAIRSIILENKAQLEVVGMIDEKEPLDRTRVDQLMETLKMKFKEDAIPYFSLAYSCNNIAEKVLELTAKRESDLLVINANLDNNWKEIFIGSYTQQIVNHAKVPVLSFKEEFRPAEIMQSKIQVASWAEKSVFSESPTLAYL